MYLCIRVMVSAGSLGFFQKSLCLFFDNIYTFFLFLITSARNFQTMWNKSSDSVHYFSTPYLWGWPSQVAQGKESKSVCQCRRHRFDPWVRKIPWGRKWQPIPVFLGGKFHGQRSLEGWSPWGRKESDTTKHTYTSIGIAAAFLKQRNRGIGGWVINSWYRGYEVELSYSPPCEILIGCSWSAVSCNLESLHSDVPSAKFVVSFKNIWVQKCWENEKLVLYFTTCLMFALYLQYSIGLHHIPTLLTWVFVFFSLKYQ